jgi:YD repeat-containing protein
MVYGTPPPKPAPRTGLGEFLPPFLEPENLPDTVAANLPARLEEAALNATFVPALAPSTSIVYNGSGQVTSVTENGITTTYTYNADGTVNTETRLGKVRTWVYDGSGNPTSSTVV